MNAAHKIGKVKAWLRRNLRREKDAQKEVIRLEHKPTGETDTQADYRSGQLKRAYEVLNWITRHPVRQWANDLA